MAGKRELASVRWRDRSHQIPDPNVARYVPIANDEIGEVSFHDIRVSYFGDDIVEAGITRLVNGSQSMIVR